MGVSVSSGNTSVTGAVATGLPILTATQVPIHVVTTGTGGHQTVYTVPTGKTFYLYGVVLTGTAGLGQIFENDDSTEVCRIQTNATLQTATIMSNVPLATYSATQNVKGLFGNTFVYNIFGILVG